MHVFISSVYGKHRYTCTRFMISVDAIHVHCSGCFKVVFGFIVVVGLK